MKPGKSRTMSLVSTNHSLIPNLSPFFNPVTVATSHNVDLMGSTSFIIALAASSKKKKKIKFVYTWSLLPFQFQAEP